jgi:hypothetical protein
LATTVNDITNGIGADVRTPIAHALLSGAFVWLTGFGALNVWWLATRHTVPAGMPGLYQYYSATWGDGLLLPVAVGGLWFLTRQVKASQQPISRRLIVVSTIVGTIGGGMSQVGWLLDPAPRLNWTFVQPHHFTAAGWYHAMFLVVITAVVVQRGALLLACLRRSSAKPGIDAQESTDLVLRSTPFTLTLLALVGFAALVLRDSSHTPFTIAQLTTWSLVMSGIAFFVLFATLLTRGSVWFGVSRLIMVLLWCSSVLAATFIVSSVAVPLFGVVSVGLSIVFVLGQKPTAINLDNLLSVLMLSFVSTSAMAVTFQWQPGSIGLALAAAAIGTVTATIFALCVCAVFPTWGDILGVNLHFRIVITIGVWLLMATRPISEVLSAVTLGLVTLVSSNLLKQITSYRFDKLIKAENTADQATRYSMASQVWNWLGGTYLAALAAVVTLSLGAVQESGLFQPGTGSTTINLATLFVGAIVACALAAIAAVLPKSGGFRLMLLLSGAAAWTVLVLLTQPLPLRWYYSPWIVVAAIIVAAVTRESVLSNVARLNNMTISPMVHVLATGLAVLAAVNTYWVLAGVAAGTGYPSVLSRAMLSVGLAFTVHLILITCAGVAIGPPAAHRLTPYPTWFCLFQDNALFLGSVFVFGFVPLFVFRHVEPLTWIKFWKTVLALGPTLAFSGGVLLLTLKNNNDHLKQKQIEWDAAATDGARESMMPIDYLRAHIKFQNRAAVVLAFVTVIGAVNPLGEVRDLQRVLFWPPGPHPTKLS